MIDYKLTIRGLTNDYNIHKFHSSHSIYHEKAYILTPPLCADNPSVSGILWKHILVRWKPKHSVHAVC
jgi:hypothetical protein